MVRIVPLFAALMVALFVAEHAAAETRTVELRIVQYFVKDAESTRLKELVGSLDPRDSAARGVPQYSGEEADQLVGRLDKSFKPNRELQIELPLDAGRPSKFKVRSGEQFSEGSLAINEKRDGSAAMSLTLNMSTQTGRLQTTVELGDGTVGKPVALVIGGMHTNEQSGRKRTQETQVAIAIARVVAVDSK